MTLPLAHPRRTSELADHLQRLTGDQQDDFEVDRAIQLACESFADDAGFWPDTSLAAHWHELERLAALSLGVDLTDYE